MLGRARRAPLALWVVRRPCRDVRVCDRDEGFSDGLMAGA